MRKIKKTKWLVVLMVVAMLVSLGPAMVVADIHSCIEPPDGAKEVTLYAGQHIDVGTVYVWNDTEVLYVQYRLDDDAWDDGEGWGLYETHVHVGKDLADFPLNRPGNPRIGHFAYKATHDGVQCYEEVIPLGDWEADDELLIAAHAVIKRVTCEEDVFTPELAWQRSSEEVVASFPNFGAEWTKEEGFAISLDPNELVWDGGTSEQNYDEYTVRGDISWASWKWVAGDGKSGFHPGDGADLRRFQATFEIPDGYTITAGKLASVNLGHEGVIPINDNIYIFVNEDLLFWGGTILHPLVPSTIDTFLGLPGREMHDWDKTVYPESDGWYMLGTIPEITSFVEGENVIDVFTEDFSEGGGMHELGLTLEYEECIWENETAWGAGTRFVERGNWATYFCYTIEDVCEEQQLLLNPGAENGMNNWEYTASVVRSITEREQSTGMVYSRSGDYFFDFTGANVASEGIGYAAFMKQEVDVSGYDGCPFTAGGWIQTELWPDSTKTDVEDNDYGKLIVTFYDNDDNELDFSDTGIIGNPVEGSPTTDGKQYAEFYLTGTVPAGAAYAVYKLEGYLIQGSFINVFYDDLYFWVGK